MEEKKSTVNEAIAQGWKPGAVKFDKDGRLEGFMIFGEMDDPLQFFGCEKRRLANEYHGGGVEFWRDDGTRGFVDLQTYVALAGSECTSKELKPEDLGIVKDPLFIHLQESIAMQLGKGLEEITPTARFVEDLEVDSIDAVEMIMAFEEEYKAVILDKDLPMLKTPGDVYRYMKRKGCFS